MLTQQDLELRRTGITASDLGGILGISKYDTPLSVYERKLMPVADMVPSPAAARGHAMEPLIAEAYRIKHGLPMLEGPMQTMPKAGEPWMIATPDYRWPGNGVPFERRLVEIKTTSTWLADEWGPSGSGEIPYHPQVQVAWQMAVFEEMMADVVVLIADESVFTLLAALAEKFGVAAVAPQLLDLDMREYTINRDKESERNLVKVARNFYERYVKARQMPAPVAADKEVLARLFNAPSDLVITASPEQVDLMWKRERLREQLATIEAEKEEVENELKVAIGLNEACALVAMDGSIKATWSFPTSRETVDVKGLLTSMEEIGQPIPPEILKENTKQGKEYRSFTVRAKKAK